MSNTKEKVKEVVKIKETTNIKVETPPDYKVTLLNNPITSFMAVTDVLTTIFNRSRAEAEQIMFIAHSSGRASVIVSTKEICDMKVSEAEEYCKKKEGETELGRNMFYTHLVFEVEENS